MMDVFFNPTVILDFEVCLIALNYLLQHLKCEKLRHKFILHKFLLELMTVDISSHRWRLHTFRLHFLHFNAD